MTVKPPAPPPLPGELERLLQLAQAAALRYADVGAEAGQQRRIVTQ